MITERLSWPLSRGLSDALTLSKGVSWAIRPATLDLDMANARLASLGNPQSFSAFMASYFTRGSAAYDARLADPLTIDSFATDVPRTRGDGLLIGPAATRLSTHPQAPQSWANSGATLSNLAADGQWLPVDVASAGSSGNGLRIGSVTTYAFTSGTPVSIMALYKAGTSGRVRFDCYNVTTTNVSSARGVVGSLAVNSVAAGTITNLTEVQVTPGWYLGAFTFAPNGTHNHIVIVSPDTASVGQNIRVYGGQVTNTPYPREWILGTAGSTQAVAQSILRLTAAQAGVVASDQSLFWRGVPLGFDPSSATRLLSSDQTTVTLSRVLFYIGTDGKAVVTINDDTNTTVAIATSAASVIGSDLTLGITWGAGSCRMKIGAASAVNDASAASPTGVTSLTIGSRIDNAGASLARHKRVVAIPRRLTDAEFDEAFARLAA